MTSCFHRPDVQAELWVENVPLAQIAAKVGTPTYVYSAQHLTERYQRLDAALKDSAHDIFYAVKANSNIGVLKLFRQLGANFDIVSGGELQRVLAAGGTANQIMFSGVGKSTEEIDFAVKTKVGCINVESEAELNRISARAKNLQATAPISVRVNPNVDAQTHPYISTGLKENKFGVPATLALALYAQAQSDPNLEVVGVDCHIGSQIATAEPLVEALDNLLELVAKLKRQNIRLQHIDLGGGFGVQYQNEPDFNVEAYGQVVAQKLKGTGLRLAVEPGRFLVANGGLLLTRVEYLKPKPEPDHKSFAVVDAAMNDLIRPALYQAWHDVELVHPVAPHSTRDNWDIVGPVCESGDFLAQNRSLALTEGALLAIHSAGAYGMVQASNYNSRSRPAEVMVDGDQFRVIRRRETIRDQLALEMDYPNNS